MASHVHWIGRCKIPMAWEFQYVVTCFIRLGWNE